MNGFILLHRDILEWGWYKDPNVKSVFLHCLLSASFKDGECRGKTVKAGQFITSRHRLSLDLGLSEMQVRNALEKLQKTKEITIETTNAYTVITVMKWDAFQNECCVDNQQNNQQNNQRITNEQPHLNNVNNVNISISCASAPKISQIRDYVKQKNLNVDPEIFFEYYTDNGWRTTRGKAVVDWKLQLRLWDKNEKNKPRKKYSYATYNLELFEKTLNEDKG